MKNKDTCMSGLLQHQSTVFSEVMEYAWNRLLLRLKTTEGKLEILINLSRHLSLDVESLPSVTVGMTKGYRGNNVKHERLNCTIIE